MKKIIEALVVWFGRDTSSVLGSLVKREDDYITLNMKGGNR